MPKKSKMSRRTYILPPEDEARLQKLRDYYDGRSETRVSLADAVRIALRDACRARGLEPMPTDPSAPTGGAS